ncbi:hypothetical protein TNCV_4995931 [Trichonephila clavipes]|nr:hypothetical protein TNCV_4995931 [Trichonephila clavipes]
MSPTGGVGGCLLEKKTASVFDELRAIFHTENHISSGHKSRTGFIRCLTPQKQKNSGSFIKEVQPLTYIVQFSRNVFDMPLHPQRCCLMSPCP